MKLNNALDFIDRVMKDDTYRKSFYQRESISEIETILKDDDIFFNYGHFEDAINKKIGDAENEEEANSYRQIEGWWNMLLNSLATVNN